VPFARAVSPQRYDTIFENNRGRFYSVTMSIYPDHPLNVCHKLRLPFSFPRVAGDRCRWPATTIKSMTRIPRQLGKRNDTTKQTLLTDTPSYPESRELVR
jgi:hypothetical protein